MEFNEAFKIIFGFDISNFDEAYENSCMGSMVDSLEKARDVKAAYEYLKEKFGWKMNFSIYKYPNSAGYAVENDNIFSIPDIEKVE